MNYVLITGASSGIGMHLAHEFAKHHHSLVIVAPVRKELEALQKELRKEGSPNVHILAKDLEQPGAAQEIFDATAGQKLAIDILVNNAGHGWKGKFWENDLEKDLSMIRLNIEAVVRMTKLFLPSMLKRNQGRILNTASVAGFEPGPLLAVYHATKAFVLSLSEALATELENTGITVTALCPGPTDTDFFPKADMMEVRGFQQGNLMAPQEVAAAGYEAVMKGERVVVPGGVNKALVFARRVLSDRAQSKINENFYTDVKPAQHKRERGDKERKYAAPRIK